MAIVEITLEIPLEVQEDLERLAKLGVYGRGPVDVGEYLLAMATGFAAGIMFGTAKPGDPEPRGIVR